MEQETKLTCFTIEQAVRNDRYCILPIYRNGNREQKCEIIDAVRKDCQDPSRPQILGHCQQRTPGGLIQGFAKHPEPKTDAQIVVECYDLEEAAEVVWRATRDIDAYKSVYKEYISNLVHKRLEPTLKAMGEYGSDKPRKKEPVKQVIVVRADLKMSPGKIAAQAAHAAIAWTVQRLSTHLMPESWDLFERLHKKESSGGLGVANSSIMKFSMEELIWMRKGQSKICLRVNSEKELLEIQDQALKAGLNVHLITDAGKTEFNGVPTKTCMAIGPHYESKIDKITGALPLL